MKNQSHRVQWHRLCPRRSLGLVYRLRVVPGAATPSCGHRASLFRRSVRARALVMHAHPRTHGSWRGHAGSGQTSSSGESSDQEPETQPEPWPRKTRTAAYTRPGPRVRPSTNPTRARTPAEPEPEPGGDRDRTPEEQSQRSPRGGLGGGMDDLGECGEAPGPRGGQRGRPGVLRGQGACSPGESVTGPRWRPSH